MRDSDVESLTPAKLRSLRRGWSKPDEDKGVAWEFDDVPRQGLGDWMNYDHEMRDGLGMFGCKTFDELVSRLSEKLRRKPNVVDLMGGAYFLREPGQAKSLVGIRIRDKDEDFLAAHKGGGGERSKLFIKVKNSANRRVIEADVLSNEGWRLIRKGVTDLADLLVCRPIGPFDNKRAMANMLDNPATYAGLYASLFRRMLSLVNRKGGVIFAEVPDIYPDSEIADFFTSIDKKEGSQTKLFTVPDKDYSWGGKKRRYAVIQF